MRICEMGRECSMNRRDEKCILVGKSKGKNYFRDLGLDGRIILNGS
jgi:hypothetical protein